jgi:hypothetical protein
MFKTKAKIISLLIKSSLPIELASRIFVRLLTTDGLMKEFENR